jgi:hypothetical protein
MEKKQPAPKEDVEKTKQELKDQIRKNAWQLRRAGNFNELPSQEQKLIENLLVEGE